MEKKISARNTEGSYSKNQFTLSWKNNGETTDFILTTKLVDDLNAWTSFAFSEDELMVLRYLINSIKTIF
jgi:hypothetical protein